MKTQSIITVALIFVISAILIVGCAKQDAGKIPITTSSRDARQLFLQGRDYFETLQAQESRQFFEQAVEKDPNFASAYLFLAFSQPNVKDFFMNLEKAKALMDQVSDGEKWYILGVDAGVNGFPMKQREYYQKMVEAYPNDERAHNLLGNNYFGQQEYQKAIEAYNRALEINPEFSQPYNQLGYAYRFLENYTEAEEAFKTYVELIPDDPNPYDSYAELLMKIGKYDESIEKYHQALDQNPNFVASFIGIATNYNLKGEFDAARDKLRELQEIARNDGERRAALFGMAVSYADEGNLDQALKMQEEQFAIAEKIPDPSLMAADLAVMGNILLEKGEYDKALKQFNGALEIIDASNLSEDVKNNTRRNHLYNTARVALKMKDFAVAKANAGEFKKQVEAINAPFQIKLSHELAGMIALEEKKYDQALQEFQQANLQNPYNWYRMALAHKGIGDTEQVKECCNKSANYNSLNNINYAFCRHKAQNMLKGM